ncbi:FadR family transcriptional regulator, partial [candidate division KSB1 bacterium]|nr:FadR family transcriptional regulator [candidate division KSB1 bacterium]
LDLEFHLTLAKASGNPLIPLIMDPLYRLLPKIKTLIVSNVKHVQRDSAQYLHQKIFEKILSQDGEGAFNEMKEHLTVAERDAKILIETISDNGLFS